METGPSDFHKLLSLSYTFLKKPNIPIYQDYKRFQNDLFWLEHDYELSKLDVRNLEFEYFLKNVYWSFE